MKKENIEKYKSIVGSALDKILIAKRTIDKRKREKAIRDAEIEAYNMVRPFKAELTAICEMGYLGDELFDWGHLEGDLRDVYSHLDELEDAQ